MGSGTSGKYGETVGLDAAKMRAGELGSTLEHVYPKNSNDASRVHSANSGERKKLDCLQSGTHAVADIDKTGLTLLEKNAQAMEGRFAINEHGNFGKKGKNSRVIEGEDPIGDSKAFYSHLSDGGIEESLDPHSKGVKTLMPEGSIITYRVVTKTPNSPAVDIRIIGQSSVNSQKIHFERGD